nr:uncharacterized protein LOC109147828 [Ipomoea trifida]
MEAGLGLDGVWSVPPSGYLKCNVEIALFSNDEKEAHIVKARVSKEALLWLKDSGYRGIIVETDYLNVI